MGFFTLTVSAGLQSSFIGCHRNPVFLLFSEPLFQCWLLSGPLRIKERNNMVFQFIAMTAHTFCSLQNIIHPQRFVFPRPPVTQTQLLLQIHSYLLLVQLESELFFIKVKNKGNTSVFLLIKLV